MYLSPYGAAGAVKPNYKQLSESRQRIVQIRSSFGQAW